MLTYTAKAKLDARRATELMGAYEDATGKEFGAMHPELEERIWDAISTGELGQKYHIGFLMARLTKVVDEARAESINQSSNQMG